MSNKTAKRKVNSRTRVLLTILFALVVCGVVLTIFLGRSGQSSSAQRLPFSVGTSFAFCGDGVVYVSGPLLQYDDLGRGKNNWQWDLAQNDIKVSASDTIIVIYSSNFVQAFSPDGSSLTSRLAFESEVVSVQCGITHFAVLRRDASATFALSLITLEGKQLEPLSFNYGYAVDYRFYPSSDQLWALSLNSEGSQVISTITTYNTGETITGVMSMTGELIGEVQIGSENLYAIGTTNLFAFDRTGKQQDKRLIYGWQVLDSLFTDKKNMFLLRPTPEDGATPITSTSAKLITFPSTSSDIDFRLPPVCLGAFLYADKIVAITSNSVYIYDLQGVLQRSYALDGLYSSIQNISQERLLLSDGSGYFIVPIR